MQPDAAMTKDDFKAWRTAMGWSQSQAAHVLLATRRSVIAWEAGDQPIGGQVEHLARSAEMLRTIMQGNFFGNALGVLQHHHAKLIARMKEADALPGRERWSLERARDALLAGELTSRSNGVDDTAATAAQIDGVLAKDETILAKHRE